MQDKAITRLHVATGLLVLTLHVTQGGGTGSVAFGQNATKTALWGRFQRRRMRVRVPSSHQWVCAVGERRSGADSAFGEGASALSCSRDG